MKHGPLWRESLATAIRDSLNDDPTLPLTDVELTVTGEDVVLAGRVEWRYQSERIEYLVDHVEGVRSVRNEIAMMPVVEADQAITATVAKAARDTDPGAVTDIRIEVDGEGTLTLLGRVHSATAYRAALAAAWAAPGIQDVRDELLVDR